MVAVTTDINKARQVLVERYKALPSPDKEIVQLFSVIYESVSRTNAIACLNHAGIHTSNNSSFNGPNSKPYFERLIEQELLTQSGGQGPRCNPLIVEIVIRDAIKAKQFETFATTVHAKLPVNTRWKGGPVYFLSNDQLVREVRIGLYRNDGKFIYQQIDIYRKYAHGSNTISLEAILEQVCNNPFDADWLCTLSKDLIETILSTLLNQSMMQLTPADEAFECLEASIHDAKAQPTFSEQVLWIEQLIWRGQVNTAMQAIKTLEKNSKNNVSALKGWLAFLQGEDEAAIALYSEALQFIKKNTGKRKVFFQSMSGLFFILALLRRGTPEDLQEAETHATVAQQAKNWLSDTYAIIVNLVKVQQGDLTKKNLIAHSSFYLSDNSIDVLMRALCIYWADREQAKKKLPSVLEQFYDNARTAHYGWVVMEVAELLGRLNPRSNYRKQAQILRKDSNIKPLVDCVDAQEAWELSLRALSNLSKDAKPSTATTKALGNQRLAWYISLYTTGYSLQPREQTINAKGEWSKGRPIALKRLTKAGDLSYLTPQDLQICAHVKTSRYGYYGQTDYVFAEQAIVALIGHPYVFLEGSPNTRVEIVKGEPELLVKKTKEGQLAIKMSPAIKDKQEILTIKETPTRLKVIEITNEHRRIAEILGPNNHLEVPEAAKERVLSAISAVSGLVTVHSDIGGGATSAEEVPADAKPHIHLLPAGEGLRVTVLTRPFAQDGPYYQPGQGGATVIAELEGKRLQTTRNLKEEKKLAKAAIVACPILADLDDKTGEWILEDPQDCLELLLQLQALAENIVIEWPQGEKMKINHQVGFSQFRMKIQRQNDWFNTTGELQLDDRSVLDMQQLMGLLDQAPGRFVPLGNGEFLALTQEFRKRLEELRAFSEKSGKGMRVHPLAAFALEDWVDEVGELKADKHWKAHIQRLKEVQDLDPVLPSTLQAELRDYQLDGFRWLSRLAHWGVGACLADDMGLGKTLQALAVILTLAPQGPTLIIAPTSVGMNWLSEAQRFTPTLNPIQFGSGDRQKLLDSLQPFDLLVCSYGLLQQDEVAEMLAKVQWQTIVLDEAQSIKNFATKRSQAAMNLQGKFKIITTGTPIENHLGELWNLFRFINPGLLGSLENFNQRFATPIERYQDKQARHNLKKLIQPFLLRRTKNQVLSELPSRTEILLHVDLSQEEMAFYEALRREAIAKLADSEVQAGQKHLQVLAAIMKLRRACCNTQLVRPEMPLPSAKLQLFGEVLEELLSNQHKALVFSQFVDHLHLIREHLEEQKISYQYLDGSTPTNERKKRVNAFQAGDGDVFLISLKAGGTGLNLTAADYVIHMDPWWNPAVEDQASDRAHRIGQQRPVTIYRLVARNTIEEKIVALHQHKRDLADNLLEGTEISGKMSTDELLRLISET